MSVEEDDTNTVIENDIPEEDDTNTVVENEIPENNDGEELGSEISKSITVILKAVTHRGTQTAIQCNPDQSRENFIDMIINTKL